MPGLNQLKNFVDNATSLGDEINVRRSRGETIDQIVIPEGISEADDSDDFIDGLPVQETAEEPADENTEADASAADVSEEDDFEIEPIENSDDINNGSDNEPLDLDALLGTSDTSSTEETPAEDSADVSPDLNVSENADEGSGEFDLSSMVPSADDTGDMNAFDEDAAADSTDVGDSNFEMPDFNIDDSDNGFTPETPESETASGDEALDSSLDLPDFDLDLPKKDDDSEPSSESSDDIDLSSMGFGEEASSESDAPMESDLPDMGASFDAENGESEVPAGEIETPSFELKGFDDEPEEKPVEENVDDIVDDDFSIPGFSDVTSAEDVVAAKAKPEPAPAEDEDENVPHDDTLFTQTEYKKFLENLNYYPLNLRFEIENLLVENQFSDAENAKLIRMVIKKVPVRQLASHVGNLVDKHIDVPRNYEKRTAAQYEAYKASAEYQLKNKILPMAIAILIIGLFVGIVAKLGYEFAYKPLRAEHFYKEGYACLENDDFKQSEICLYEAISFQPKKKWIFKFARGYRDKRQYKNARDTYEKILRHFPKDKTAGLEYAEMELSLNNFEGAESIVRRKVLDNFINDSDGMLLLGDIYLEWATQKDPEKFADALQMYATVMDIYGQNDTYLGRMLRYYIRTDNLREVLPLKSYFYPDKKVGPKKIKKLPASDVLELSEYLLKKLYGELSPAEEYLREYIEDVRALLERAIEADPKVPEAYYNYARYFIYSANLSVAQTQLENALNVFEHADVQTPKRILKHVDTFRLLGELYTDQQEYLKAEELYTKGISLFEEEKDISELNPTSDIGKLYSDMADLDYFISGDNDQALRNYLHSCEYQNDTSSIRYRIGYIQYGKGEYVDAVASFIKASEEHGTDLHMLLAISNALALREDYFAAQGYYERFLNQFTKVRSQISLMLPQVQKDHEELVENYMYATNNYGVTLNKIAERTGNSNLNAKSMVYFSESIRSWDSLTRNQQTLVRLDGSCLAAQNMKYLSYPQSEYEPALYYDIPRTLQEEEILVQPTLKAALSAAKSLTEY